MSYDSRQIIVMRGIQMSSPAKVSANRENALKSTGPSSARGKSKSSLNALKFGLYAKTPVLPGEDLDAYQEIVKSNLEYFAPVGPVENLLVSQITTEQWRLERIKWAENALPSRMIKGQIVRFIGSLNMRETAYISASYAGELREEIHQARNEQEAADLLLEWNSPGLGRIRPSSTSDEEMKDGVEASLARILEPDNTLLECLVPTTETAPQTDLVHERRVAVRAYLGYVSKLQELQETRLTVTLSSRPQPMATAEKHTNAKRSARLSVKDAANQNQSEVGDSSQATAAPLPTPKAD